MVNFNAYSSALNQGGGFVTPRFGYGAGALAQQGQPVQPSVRARDVLRQKEDPWYITLGGSLAASPVDIVDSIASAFPGVERGQVNDTVYNSLGMSGYARWVRENKDAVEMTSGIVGVTAGAIGVEMAIARTIGSAWFASSAVGRGTQGLWQMNARAAETARQATMAAAESGQVLRWYQGANLTSVMSQAGTNALRSGIAEGAVVAAMHKNEAVWDPENPGWSLAMIGLGAGIGGLFGGIAGRGQVQRWINSPEVSRTLARAADPQGLERSFNTTPDYGAHPTHTRIKDSSVLTTLQVNARRDEVAAQAVSGQPVSIQRNAIQTATQDTADRVLQRMATKGAQGIPDSSFAVRGQNKVLTPAGAQVKAGLTKDPTLLYGADDIGAWPVGRSLDDISTARDAQIRDLSNSWDMPNRVTASVLKKQTMMTIADGGFVGNKLGEEFAKFRPELVDVKLGPQTEVVSHGTGHKFVINENGMLNSNKVDFATLSVPDQLSVAEAGRQFIQRGIVRKETLALSKSPTFFQLDLAAEYARRGGTIDTSALGRQMDADELEVMSLSQKAASLAKKTEVTDLDRFKHNLPLPTNLERITDPEGVVTKKILAAATKEGTTVDELRKVKAQMFKLFDLTVDMKVDDSVNGNLFNFNRSPEGGSWMQPVVAFFDDTPKNKWSKFDLEESNALNKISRANLLRSSEKAPLTRGLTDMILSNPAMAKANDISHLDDAMIHGTDNIVGQSASQFVTQNHRFRNTPALLAAQAIRADVNRVVEHTLNETLKAMKPFSDAFASASGRGSKVLMDQYQSLAGGWDIARVVRHGDHYAFELATDSATNSARLGREVEAGELMKNMETGKPVVLDELGNQAREAMENITNSLLHEENVHRLAMGFAPVKLRPFYTFPPKTKGKIVGFTLDSANRVVPGGAIIADTEAEFSRMVRELEPQLEKGQRFLRQSEIEQRVDLYEQAQIGFIDPTRVAMPGKQRRGGLASNRISSATYEDFLTQLKDRYDQLGTRTISSIFDSQLKTASIRSAAQEAAGQNRAGVRNIWDTYRQTMLGRSASSDPVGLNIPIMAAEKALDTAIAALWPSRKVAPNWVRNAFDMAGLKHIRPVKGFSGLVEQLGDHTPFADAAKWLEYEKGIKPPPTVRGAASTLNSIGAGVILRWLEFPHAAMNMAGIITNMPSILRSSNVPTIGRVNNVPVVDAVRIMGRGFKRMMGETYLARKGFNDDVKHMVENGDMSQAFAEMTTQMSLIKGRSSWMKVMAGDPSFKHSNPILQGAGQKGISGIAAVVTDTSEDMSRRWAHFVGLELAEMNGIVGMKARHDFARNIANDAIANYDPMNRPEIFQSGFGTMYGLFLSYTQAYYQRLFRYIEDKDWAALGMNAVTQSSLFGFASLPGVNQVADLFGGEKEGDDMLTTLYRKYGAAAGNVVANGGFNQLTTIFGLPPMALHTRGDINFRHPSLDAAMGRVNLPVGLEILADMTAGAWEAAAKPLLTRDPNWSLQFAGEVFARQMPNRLLKGAMGVAVNGGYEVDAYGNAISSVESDAEAWYRTLGFRSARQQAQVEAYFLNQKARDIDAQRMDDLRLRTRALVREGSLERLPSLFEDYMEAGGSPWNYSNWIRTQIVEAQNTRTENQLLQALRSPSQQMLAERIRIFTGQDLPQPMQ